VSVHIGEEKHSTIENQRPCACHWYWFVCLFDGV